LPGKISAEFSTGERLTVATPGGGGWGAVPGESATGKLKQD